MVLDRGSVVVLGMKINRFGTGVRRLGNNFGTSARGASLNEIMTTGGWRCAHMWQYGFIHLIIDIFIKQVLIDWLEYISM